MKWSQLKRRMEGLFADSVRGRVEVWNTRYRHAHDGEGEAWITIDGQVAYSMGSLGYLVKHHQGAERLRKERGCTDYRNPDHASGYYAAWREARRNVAQAGEFALWDFNGALFDYLNMSIDEILCSDHPIIRGFGMLDRRLGKRRLTALKETIQHPFVGLLYEFRCRVEETA